MQNVHWIDILINTDILKPFTTEHIEAMLQKRMLWYAVHLPKIKDNAKNDSNTIRRLNV